ncbi:MAG: hypothetical protein K2Y05_00335, partial [Hyphomicrobiaceae bacterium]|nr:hypothetical protein [Hyphomicrobiaceae bacterium]
MWRKLPPVDDAGLAGPRGAARALRSGLASAEAATAVDSCLLNELTDGATLRAANLRSLQHAAAVEWL